MCGTHNFGIFCLDRKEKEEELKWREEKKEINNNNTHSNQTSKIGGLPLSALIFNAITMSA